jgi:hypothetical protein
MPAVGLPIHMLGADSMSSRKRNLCAKRNLDALIRDSAPVFSHALQPYWRLITAIRASSQLLTPVLNCGRIDPDSQAGIIRACVRMAKHRRAWRQQPESWIVPHGSPFMQFRSLVSHLFDEFPVPTFMAPVWTCAANKPWEIDMYLHLAAGRSIRQFKLPLDDPVKMTKRAARWWMSAPDDIWPISAYRWAQVRALGGDNRLARTLLMTPALVIPTEHEDFWETVIRFLIEHSPISSSEIEAIVNFIHEQRFCPAERVWGPGAGEQPLQPHFSMKGRTLLALRRHMTNWRDDLFDRLPVCVPKPSLWTRSSISPFRQKAGDILWTIDELLSAQELRVEGGMMKHCVATYTSDCARRRTSIWSMKMQQGERRVRALTIEVLPNSRIIWQAKGRKNASPDGAAKEMLCQWAEQEGLTFRDLA